jgi:hypothetical protein
MCGDLCEEIVDPGGEELDRHAILQAPVANLLMNATDDDLGPDRHDGKAGAERLTELDMGADTAGEGRRDRRGQDGFSRKGGDAIRA